MRPIDVTLQVGATQQLQADVTIPPGAPAGTSRGVSYVSSDTTVATVSATGLITGVRGGTAVVTVAMLASPGVTQAVAVTVRDRSFPRFVIATVTTGDPPVAVDLSAVRGRIRVTTAVDADPTLGPRRAELWLAGRRAAVLDSIPRGTGAGGVRELSLEVDTGARDAAGARLYPNGETRLEVRMEFCVAGTTATQRVDVPLSLTLANP